MSYALYLHRVLRVFEGGGPRFGCEISTMSIPKTLESAASLNLLLVLTQILQMLFRRALKGFIGKNWWNIVSYKAIYYTKH